MRRLTKIEDKMSRAVSEMKLSCAAAEMPPATKQYQHMASRDAKVIQYDYPKLFMDMEWCMEFIKDSENKIADLEQKLRSASSS